MHWNVGVPASKPLCPDWTRVVGVLPFIALGLAGLLALSWCATTQRGSQREEGLYLVLSNSLPTNEHVHHPDGNRSILEPRPIRALACPQLELLTTF